jgi:hypothetical protein
MADIHRAYLSTSTLSPLFKITYFDLKARGLAIFILLENRELPYEADIIKLSQWAERKPMQPAFCKQLPCLQCDETIIGQSVAIMNVIAASAPMHERGPDFAVSQMLTQ